MKGVMKDTLTNFEKALTGAEPWPPDTKERINAMEVAEETAGCGPHPSSTPAKTPT